MPSLTATGVTDLDLSLHGGVLTVTWNPAVQNPPPAWTRVMPLGDSITLGLYHPGGYRVRLESRLRDAGVTVTFVGSQANGPVELLSRAHEGHSGYTIAQLQSGAAAWLAASRPGTVLLHVGTNDLAAAGGVPGSGAAAALAAQGLVALVLASLAPGARLFVAGIIPVVGAAAVNAQIVAYNGLVQSHVAGLGDPNVRFVDLYTPLATNAQAYWDVADVVHPNAAGDSRMGDGWFDDFVAAGLVTVPPPPPPPPSPPGTAVRRFDFDAGTGPTQSDPPGGVTRPVRLADQPGVGGSDHGWASGLAREFDTGLSPAKAPAFFRDFHWGSQASFQVACDPARTYTLRAYLGDCRGYAYSGVLVRAYDAASTPPAYRPADSPAGGLDGSVVEHVFAGLAAPSGRLALDLLNPGGFWVLPGFDLWDDTASAPASLLA